MHQPVPQKHMRVREQPRVVLIGMGGKGQLCVAGFGVAIDKKVDTP